MRVSYMGMSKRLQQWREPPEPAFKYALATMGKVHGLKQTEANSFPGRWTFDVG